jgi:hypothetical protein
VFSQPSNDGIDTGSATDANPTLISIAATLAHRDGNPEALRGQLPPSLHAAFDMAYQVQAMRGDNAVSEKERRISMRTEDAIEKARAARSAAEVIADEERKALYAAADADGDTFDLLSPLDLDGLPEPDPLIEGFLNKESVIRLYGPPKSYKSFVMLDMAACIGAGIPWHGKKTVQSKVLYVVAEGVRGIRRRVRAWEAQNKRAMVGVHFHREAVQLGDRDQVKQLLRTAKRGGFEMIILDTQARCTVGLEENSASEMGIAVAALDVLKEVTGACVALVHHSGATGGRARGSTAILGALDGEFEVEAKKETMTVKVITTAQKDLAEHPVVEMDLVTPGPGLSLAVKPRPQWYRATPADLPPLPAGEMNVLRIVDSFGGAGATASVIGRQHGDKVIAQQALGQLIRKGCVRQKGATWYIDRVGRTHLEGTLDSVHET